MNTIATSKAAEYILSIWKDRDTKIFRVTNYKGVRDKSNPSPEVRDFLCAFWNEKLKGKDGTYHRPGDKNLVLVWDIQKQAPRYINLESILAIKAQGNPEVQTDFNLQEFLADGSR